MKLTGFLSLPRTDLHQQINLAVHILACVSIVGVLMQPDCGRMAKAPQMKCISRKQCSAVHAVFL